MTVVMEPEGTGASAERPEPSRRRPARWAGAWRQLAAELTVVTAAGVMAFLHLRDAFHLSNDDLLQLTVAREEGLGWGLLGLNVWGHFGPVNRLAHGAFLQWAGLDLTLGAAVAAVLVSALALTVLWVCRELRLSPVRRVLVVAFTGFSIAVLDSAVWFDAAMHVLVALIATYAVVAAHLRALNRGSRRWHAVSVLLFAASLLVQERPLFALPLIVLTDLLLVTAGQPWRRRLGVFRQAAAPLAAMTLIAVVAAVLLRMHYTWGDTTPPLAAVGATIAGAFTGVFFPALVGFAPDVLLPPWAQFVAGAGIAALAAALVGRRRANGGPLLFVAASFLLYYAFLAFSPILYDSNVEWNALRLHNVVYAVLPALLGLAHLRLRAARGTEPGAASRSDTDRRPGRAVAVTGVVLLAVVAGVVHTERQWAGAREARAYEDSVAAGRAQWSRADTTVLPLRAPESVASEWATGLGRHEALLPIWAAGWAAPADGDRTVVLDDRAQVRPVSLREEAEGELPEIPSCLRTRPGYDAFILDLDRRIVGPALFAVVTYELTGAPGGVVHATPATGDGRDEWTVTPWRATLPADRSVAILPLEGDVVREMAMGGLEHGAMFCVASVRVVRPVYEVDGQCFLMDEYGAQRQHTACGRTGPTA